MTAALWTYLLSGEEGTLELGDNLIADIVNILIPGHRTQEVTWVGQAIGSCVNEMIEAQSPW